MDRLDNNGRQVLAFVVGGSLFLSGLGFISLALFGLSQGITESFGIIFTTGFIPFLIGAFWLWIEFGNSPEYSSSTNLQNNRPEIDKKYVKMTPDEFEYHVADLWEEQGWNTEITSSTADKGIDVIARKNDIYPEKTLIQAKKYEPGNKVTSSEVQQYSSLKQQENEVDEVIIITTSSFTSNAKARARDLNVKLIDGDGLSKLREMYMEDN